MATRSPWSIVCRTNPMRTACLCRRWRNTQEWQTRTGRWKRAVAVLNVVCSVVRWKGKGKQPCWNAPAKESIFVPWCARNRPGRNIERRVRRPSRAKARRRTRRINEEEIQVVWGVEVESSSGINSGLNNGCDCWSSTSLQLREEKVLIPVPVVAYHFNEWK